MTRQVIALAGAGDLGRYVCEEILAAPDLDLILITRGHTTEKWFSGLSVPVHTTDYTSNSVLSILNNTRATTLVSFINLSDHNYLTLHQALLEACTLSVNCKRLIPSEYIGDVESHPLKPNFYATTRVPFREALKQQVEVEWTLLNPGWLMDYFLPTGRGMTYLKPFPGKFPADLSAETACVRGTGDEAQSWTAAGDVGRAVVALCRAQIGEWEQVTYIAGEWSTFNEAIAKIEGFRGISLPKTYKSWAEIQHDLRVHADNDNDDGTLLEFAQVEEMMAMGCMAVPKEKTLRQRQKYFSGIRFLDLKTMLRKAREQEGVVK